MRNVISAVLVLVATFIPCACFAQDEAPTGSVIKDTLLDPTTYIPALVSYESQRLDWNSSQVFFEHGVTEHNAGYTVSGTPDTALLSYGAGNRKILRQSLGMLGTSVANNLGDRLFEHVLVERYPNHRKLVRTLGWVERIGVASLLAYQSSVLHFKQWQTNERVAGQLGY